MQSDDVRLRLARGAARGDPESLAELLRELEPLVVRTVRLIVGAGSWAAEDAAQEALVDLVRGISRLRAPEAATAWALRVATTRALKVARRERLLSQLSASIVLSAKLIRQRALYILTTPHARRE